MAKKATVPFLSLGEDSKGAERQEPGFVQPYCVLGTSQP